MWYWNQQNFEGLLTVADALAVEPNWSDFAEYCRLREAGRRKEALKAIEQLVFASGLWSRVERRRFVAWILDAQLRLPEVHQLVVEPLRRNLILPTLEDWQEDDPGDPIPKRLLGMATGNIKYFEEALNLDSSDDYSRYRCASHFLNDVDYQCHHLPDYFIGEPTKARDDLAAARDFAKGFVNKKIDDSFVDEFTDLSNKVDDWFAFLESNQQSFADWCAANNRKYKWCQAYYYDPHA
jgi:hypothetical protein